MKCGAEHQAKEEFQLGDILYEVEDASLYVEVENRGIILYPEVNARAYQNMEYEELGYIRLYHNSGFHTHVSTFEDLKGKRFIWQYSYNEEDEEAGTCYVVEHEEVTKGCIEIVDIIDNCMRIKWFGTANVFWDEKYGEDVPFQTQFTVKLPKYPSYKIDAFVSTTVNIDAQSTLSIWNMEEFNEEVIRVTRSRSWNTFCAILKFAYMHKGTTYEGEVIFTNGKLNHRTTFDATCPLVVELLNFDFNLAECHEVFIFTIKDKKL